MDSISEFVFAALSSAEGNIEMPALGVLINRHLGIIKIFHLMKEKCPTLVAYS